MNGSSDKDSSISIPQTTSGPKWVVEEDGIILVSLEKRFPHKLDQTDSALWQMINYGVKKEALVSFLVAVKGSTVKAAEEFLEAKLERWTTKGFLDKG